MNNQNPSQKINSQNVSNPASATQGNATKNSGNADFASNKASGTSSQSPKNSNAQNTDYGSAKTGSSNR